MGFVQIPHSCSSLFKFLSLFTCEKKYLIKMLFALILSALLPFAVQCSVIPLEERQTVQNPKSVSPAGSATVSWVDAATHKYHLRNFHVANNGLLVMSSYDEAIDSWCTARIISRPGYINNKVSDTVLALNLRPDTSTHAVSIASMIIFFRPADESDSPLLYHRY